MQPSISLPNLNQLLPAPPGAQQQPEDVYDLPFWEWEGYITTIDLRDDSKVPLKLHARQSYDFIVVLSKPPRYIPSSPTGSFAMLYTIETLPPEE